MATTMKLIAKQTLGSSAATVTFDSIPGTGYTDLVFYITARRDAAATDLLLLFNTSGGTYTTRLLYGTGSSALSATPARNCGIVCANTDTANTFASNWVYIPNYAGSTAKSWSSEGATENNGTTAYITASAGVWDQTAAITKVDFTNNGGGNFVSGSSFFLYGITKA